MRFPLSLVLATSLAALSCGGEGSTEPSKTISIKTFTIAALDGVVGSDGTFSTNGGGPATGDWDQWHPGVGYRQFFNFSLAGIPAGATVVSATLYGYQVTAYGHPFTDLGNVVVDHVDIGFTLDASDFGPGSGTLAMNVATISTDTSVGYHTADVTPEIIADLAAGRLHSSFRFRFSGQDGDNDNFPDNAAFSDGELSCCSGMQPTYVEVKYRE